MCNIEANSEYFAFSNYCKFTFSQIDIIKFLKNFVKELVNISQMALYEGFFFTINVNSIKQHKYLQKIKTGMTCEIFETKYIDISFQVAKWTEI